MSWQATAWVSTVDAGGPSGKLLLYALANYADENGRCFPGDGRLMADTELSERSIREWKRKLEEAGLLKIERRRKADGEFEVDVIRLSMAGNPPANSAGGGSSASTGKSRRDQRQMTLPPPANGANPPAPPYKAEPSEEPPVEPIERERGRDDREEEGENRKAVERAFERAYRDWPTSIADSRPEALKAWFVLTPVERELAAAEAGRYVEAAKAAGRKHVVAHGVYLREKRWEQLPPRQEVEKPSAVVAPPFGPLWMAARLKQFVTGPKVVPAGLTAFERRMVQDGLATEAALMLQKQAKTCWPAVNAMHERAANRQGVTVSTALEPLAEMMVAVPVVSDAYRAWEREHGLRGWPWLPDPGDQRVVFFPAGGPERLGEFEMAVRGGHDGDRQQAAE